MPLDYSIIIPAYNEEELLPKTLASVHEAMNGIPGFQGEVIVTDNASEDRTAEIAESYGARVVHEPKRQIARSRNAGAAASQGRYLVFLDADTVLSQAVLAETLRRLESRKCVGGGAVVVFDHLPRGRAMFWLALWTAISKSCKWAAGSYLFCLREAFEGVGGFDERFYASEEIHLSRALKRWGKSRGLRMVILDQPVTTSARKLVWFSNWQLLKNMFGYFIRPWRLRTREGCGLWYERPANGKAR